MGNFRLSRAPASLKLFITALLCMLGIAYGALLLNIWQESHFLPSMIAGHFGSMEFPELADHTVRYLPYYVIYLFAVPAGLFMFTSYSEQLKRIFAVLPLVFIGIDMGSMWAIPFISTAFAWVLWAAGMLIALSFLALFVLDLYDLWMRKDKAGEARS